MDGADIAGGGGGVSRSGGGGGGGGGVLLARVMVMRVKADVLCRSLVLRLSIADVKVSICTSVPEKQVT